MADMKISLIQQSVEWSAREANLARAEKAIEQAKDSDLYVLPEMFATGFNVNPCEIAEDADNCDVLAWMRRMADKHDAAIAGSVAVREASGAYYNRLYFVRPNNDVSHYDKRHLFTYGGENVRYRRGEERVIAEWRGVRFLLQVCYDLRFPIWSRNGRLTDSVNLYDVILYVASWPSSRMIVWDTLLRARAIENQCYVCGVNRIGSDPTCNYCGGTMVVDAYGKVMACNDSEECSLTAGLDLEKLQAFRAKFPVLSDRD